MDINTNIASNEKSLPNSLEVPRTSPFAILRCFLAINAVNAPPNAPPMIPKSPMWIPGPKLNATAIIKQMINPTT